MNIERKFNRIITECATDGTIYDEILDKFFPDSVSDKHELLSILTISFHRNMEKVVRAYEEGWFKYFFASAVKNQVCSSTSRFHADVRLTIAEKFEPKRDDIVYNTKSSVVDVEDLELVEERLKLLRECKSDVVNSWYEGEMVRLYFDEGMTFRDIEAAYDIDHVSVYLTIRGYKDKLKEYVKTKQPII